MYKTTGIKKNTLSPPGSVIGRLWWVIFPLCSPIHSYSIAAHNSYQTCFTTQRMTCFGTERNCNPMSTDWHQTLENWCCQPLAMALLSDSLTLEWSSSHLRLVYAIILWLNVFLSVYRLPKDLLLQHILIARWTKKVFINLYHL